MSRVNYPDPVKRIPFKDSQYFEACEDMAIDGTLNYDSYPPEEYKYFSKLAKLGYMNRHKGWSKEICEEKQKELRREYYSDCDKRDFFGQIAGNMQENIRRGQTLTWEINKEPDPMKKLDLALMCIGLMTGDEDFAKRNKP